MDMKKLTDKLSNRPPGILGGETFSKFAVLVPLVEKQDDIHVLFEVRSFDMRRQPGEICFPGGKVDESDQDEQHTAVRETSEELGMMEASILDVSPLDYMVSPFGTIIHPYVGVISDAENLQPNPDEVAEIFTVPLSFFKKSQPERYTIRFKTEPEQNFPFHLIAGGTNYNWQTRTMDEYFYFYEDKVIWGLTARILKHFLDVIQEI